MQRVPCISGGLYGKTSAHARRTAKGGGTRTRESAHTTTTQEGVEEAAAAAGQNRPKVEPRFRPLVRFDSIMMPETFRPASFQSMSVWVKCDSSTKGAEGAGALK